MSIHLTIFLSFLFRFSQQYLQQLAQDVEESLEESGSLQVADLASAPAGPAGARCSVPVGSEGGNVGNLGNDQIYHVLSSHDINIYWKYKLTYLNITWTWIHRIKFVFPEFVFGWRWRPPRKMVGTCPTARIFSRIMEILSKIIVIAGWDEEDWADMPLPHRWEHNIFLRVGSCQYPWYAEINHCFMGSNLKITEDMGGLRKWLNNRPTLWFFQNFQDVWWFPLQKSPEHVAHHQMNSFRSLRYQRIGGMILTLRVWNAHWKLMEYNVCIPLSRSFKKSAVPIESQPLAATFFSSAKVVTTCPPSTSEIRYWSCWVHRRWWDRIRYTPVPMLLVSRCSWA